MPRTPHPPTPALTRQVRIAAAWLTLGVALLLLAVLAGLPAYVWAADGVLIGSALAQTLDALTGRRLVRADIARRAALRSGPWSGTIPGARS